MADIDQIIAGGAGAGTTADFSGVPKILDAFYKGRDEAFKDDQRNAFKGGLPMGPDNQPDWGTISKTLIQNGAFDQGVAAANLGLQQRKLQYGQDVDSQINGGQPQAQQVPNVPSINRSATTVVAPPLNRGQPQQPPQQQPTVMTILAAQGIPNDQLGAASESLARQIGVGPTDPINPNDPQVRNVLVPAVQRLKGVGQVQPGQPQQQPQAPPQQPAPQMAPQQPQPVAQTVPQAQPVAQPQAGPDPRFVGLVPPGRTPEQQIMLLSRAIASGNLPPDQAKLYKDRIDAITKAAEPTQAEKDFQAASRNPKLDDYVAQQEASKASAKGVAEADVKEQNDLIAAGKTASNRLTTLNTLSNIIGSDKNLTLGYGADTALKVKMALKQIGIDTGDLSGAQSIQKLNALLASESTKAISPRPAQFEFKTFLGNNPGLSLDKQGNERVIGIFSQLAKREVDLGRLARQNRDNWSNWDSVVENFDKTHPIKDPTTGKVITTDSVVAPGPKATPAGSAQAAPAAYPNARRAADGYFYVPDPSRGPNKYLKVVQ